MKTYIKRKTTISEKVNLIVVCNKKTDLKKDAVLFKILNSFKKPFQTLGNLTYAIYLLHIPIQITVILFFNQYKLLENLLNLFIILFF